MMSLQLLAGRAGGTSGQTVQTALIFASHTLGIRTRGSVSARCCWRACALWPVRPGPVGGHGASARVLQLTARLRAGGASGVLLETDPDGPPRIIPPEECDRLLEGTVSFWHDWLAHSRYTGRWREMVNRSAMTLKLMTYAPSGAMIAAPTTSLPEQIGGERNWDYRYAWVRDTTLSLHALLGMGFTEEAAAFTDWMGDRVREQASEGGHPLKVMYRVDGSGNLGEETLDHWEGYWASAPVRIGNSAADQLQLDIYGSVLDCLQHADQRSLQTSYANWQALTRIVDWVCDNWERPESGIWETRGGDKNFTYGRVATWIAMDRAIRMATARGRPAELSQWIRHRNAVTRRSWNAAGVGSALRSRNTSAVTSWTPHVRQPSRPLLRGNRADRRTTGKLRPGVDEPRHHQRGADPGRPPR
jgi:hypothetical protein